MKYIIADIDGTVTIVSNRKELLPDYKAFHDRCGEDLPNEYVIDLLRLYQDSIKIIFITMRPECVRDITCEFLDKYFNNYELIMKLDIDSVSAPEYKIDSLRAYDVNDILFAVDDNQYVINAYSKNNINCLYAVRKNTRKKKKIFKRKR